MVVRADGGFIGSSTNLVSVSPRREPYPSRYGVWTRARRPGPSTRPLR